ncbi:MAG TPA: type 1 glutamine amidotransferase [Candidatus Poseidoniales archaeon]|nr:type 1 glutamine amidotransferase [Candidatus Poseidoniales archaeon]
MMADRLSTAMGGPLRVALLDLLVERAEFGHGGNMEVIAPLVAKDGRVEVFLLTPQFQSHVSAQKALISWTPLVLTAGDVPTWDQDFPFVADRTVSVEGVDVSGADGAAADAGGSDEVGPVRLLRVALPQSRDGGMETWLNLMQIDAVVCTGSRRNVSIHEPWMDEAASLMRAAVNAGLPTLGICFGHQLLCKALGGKVVRADGRTDAVETLSLTESGASDPLFSGLAAPVALFTHQDHVVELPKCGVLLASAPHNSDTAVRILDGEGNQLPVWGVQFHPEAAKHRIERSVRLGHISAEEASAFEREHDGAKILSNFAEIVSSHRRSRSV